MHRGFKQRIEDGLIGFWCCICSFLAFAASSSSPCWSLYHSAFGLHTLGETDQNTKFLICSWPVPCSQSWSCSGDWLGFLTLSEILFGKNCLFREEFSCWRWDPSLLWAKSHWLFSRFGLAGEAGHLEWKADHFVHKKSRPTWCYLAFILALRIGFLFTKSCLSKWGLEGPANIFIFVRMYLLLGFLWSNTAAVFELEKLQGPNFELFSNSGKDGIELW